MATDVRLDDGANRNWVTVDAYALNIAGTDLILDSVDHRESPHGSRRALVHDENDSLVMNYNNDYTGGVRIYEARIYDARVYLHVDYQRNAKPLLPKQGETGELLAISNSSQVNPAPDVTLWLCTGPTGGQLPGDPVYWVPITTGNAVQGTE